jgi:hypothetical protein
MIRAIVVAIALLWGCPTFAQTAPSVAEQALGAEVLACVQSRVALRAEIIGLKAEHPTPPTPPPAP